MSALRHTAVTVVVTPLAWAALALLIVADRLLRFARRYASGGRR